MAQQPSEIPINPSTAPEPPTTKPDNIFSSLSLTTAKRRREDDGEAPSTSIGGELDHSARTKKTKGVDVVFRIVVPSRQIGKVIGKEGHRIQKIREETKANIKIADVARHEERVIIISSKDSESEVMNAENALQQISSLILKVYK